VLGSVAVIPDRLIANPHLCKLSDVHLS
jgi:hypothetical protein